MLVLPEKDDFTLEWKPSASVRDTMSSWPSHSYQAASRAIGILVQFLYHRSWNLWQLKHYLNEQTKKIKWKSLTWLTVKYHKTNKLIQLHASDDIFGALLLVNAFLKEGLPSSAERSAFWKLFLDNCHWYVSNLQNALPGNEECPLLFGGWQKCFMWAIFSEMLSLSAPLLTAGNAECAEPVGNGAHTHG